MLSNKWRRYNIIVLGLGCFLVFTAFQTSANVQTTTLSIFFSNHCNPNSSDVVSYGDSLGLYSLSIIFAVNAMFTLAGPSVIAVIGEKLTLFGSSAIYCVIIAALIRPVVETIFAGSALSGIGGIIWLTQAFCVLKYSHPDSIDRNIGIFWVMMQASFVVGNLFYFLFILLHKQRGPAQQTICISWETNAIIYGCLLAVGWMGSITFLFLRSDRAEIRNDSSHPDEKEPLGKTVNDPQRVGTAGTSPQVVTRSKSDTVRDTLAKAGKNFVLTIRMMFTKKMFLLNITCSYIGLEWAFWSGIIGTLAARTLQRPEYAGLVGIAVGLGEMISGSLLVLFGKLAGRVGYDTIFVLGYIMQAVCYLLLFYTVPDDAAIRLRPADQQFLIHDFYTQLALLIVAAFLLGAGDCCLNTQTYKILSVAYPEDDKGASAVANMELYLCSMSAVSFLLGGLPSFTLKWQLLLLVAVGAVGTITYIIAARSVRREQTRN